MQSTRGAAVLLVSVDARQVLCCGIGNISGVLCAPDGTCRNMVSHNGTVGHRMARVQEFAYPWTPGTFLILHSDGVSRPVEAGAVSGNAAAFACYHRQYPLS